MAALPLSALSSFFDCSISRAMCSGPETISGGRSICVLHHGTDAARELVSLCGMREMQIRTEDEIDAFTAGICIPPILMNIKVDERERIKALKNMSLNWSVYRELSGWIEAELASSASQNDKKSLENVSTKGGVSEAMVSALLGGTSFLSSVERGIERCAELRSELCKNLAVKAAYIKRMAGGMPAIPSYFDTGLFGSKYHSISLYDHLVFLYVFFSPETCVLTDALMTHRTNFHILVSGTCPYDGGIRDSGQKEVGVVYTEIYGLSLPSL